MSTNRTSTTNLKTNFVKKRKGKEKKINNTKLTRRKAHPVGKKARMAANISDMVRPYTTNKTVMANMKLRTNIRLRMKMSPNLRLLMGSI